LTFLRRMEEPQGLTPSSFAALTARLKPCPDTKPERTEEGLGEMGRSLHCATPDFLLSLVALLVFMRLSFAKHFQERFAETQVPPLRSHGTPGLAG
jgi:hypothetical protein